MEAENLQVWERVCEGKSSIVEGFAPLVRTPSDFKVLRIHCAVPWTAVGPLHRAYREIGEWLGEVPVVDKTSFLRKEGGLRYQLLGEMPLHLVERGFLGACNRLAKAYEGRVALWFEAVDQATEEVLETLSHLLGTPQQLQLPWVISLHRFDAPSQRLRDLLAHLQEVYGEGVVWLKAGDAESTAEAPVFHWLSLPKEALRVLRAGVVIGNIFEAELVAHLLGLSLGEVLDTLQVAADAGAPLADYGDARFFVPPQQASALKEKTLPSLVAFLHDRLGAMFAGESTATSVSQPPKESDAASMMPDSKEISPSFSAHEPGQFYDHKAEPQENSTNQEFEHSTNQEFTFDVVGENEPTATHEQPFASEDSLVSIFSAREDAKADGEPHDDAGEGTSEYVDPLIPQEGDLLDVHAVGAPTMRPQPSTKTYPEHTHELDVLGRDPVRAARHLQATGRVKDAISFYLQAAQDASAVGDTRRGIVWTEQAALLLEQMPVSHSRALLESECLLEMARLQWHGALSGTAVPLQEALASIQTARATLPEAAPLALIGQIAAVFAGICYDLGEVSSLDEALQELSRASRRLLAAQEPVLAARLLNDQAALYVRLGDPLQASRLLYKSREIFENMLERQPQERTAMEELAETEHLLARLPLHAPVRAGLEFDAYTIGLRHTQTAEELYEALGMTRELSRVWETRGRLELGRKRLEAAGQCLMRAINAQKQIGDVTGLARATAALAELFLHWERFEDAAQMLGESVVFNLEKGAPIGIAFNRRTFGAMLQLLQGHANATHPRLIERIRQIDQLLQRAENLLGQVPLPKGQKEGLLHTQAR